jgi:hypothetical protein
MPDFTRPMKRRTLFGVDSYGLQGGRSTVSQTSTSRVLTSESGSVRSVSVHYLYKQRHPDKADFVRHSI